MGDPHSLTFCSNRRMYKVALAVVLLLAACEPRPHWEDIDYGVSRVKSVLSGAPN